MGTLPWVLSHPRSRPGTSSATDNSSSATPSVRLRDSSEGGYLVMLINDRTV